MLCATFVSVFRFENVCVYAAAVLSVFVARCLAFIFTHKSLKRGLIVLYTLVLCVDLHLLPSPTSAT